jgi:hypothetical protein
MFIILSPAYAFFLWAVYIMCPFGISCPILIKMSNVSQNQIRHQWQHHLANVYCQCLLALICETLLYVARNGIVR